MMRVAFILGLLFASWVAHAEKRVALVIGNSAYQHADILPNPVNDAADVAQVLRQKGFLVIEGQDLPKSTLVSKVEEFGRAIVRAEIAVFFYAGHGMQVAGQNFLLPIDAELTTPGAVDRELVPASLVYNVMKEGPRFKVVVLDACRNNPLAEDLRKSTGAAIGRGLAREDSGPGWDSVIVFSTQPGNTASDGDGRNSPFTTAFIKHLTPSDQNNDFAKILGRVRSDVAQATRRGQVPWDASSLRVLLYFDRSTQLELSEATLAWGKVSWQNYAQLEAFVNRYGQSPEADRARKMLRIPACLGLRGGKPLACVAVAGSTEKTSMTVAKSFRDCPQCPEMVIVPWGPFEMGSPETEAGREQGENQVRVTIPFHFAVGRSKVSAKEWSACVAAGACKPLGEGSSDPGDRSIEVTFEDARAYVTWLSSSTGKSYRLLSEAEWERVMRGGTSTAYWWGSSMDARSPKSSTHPWDVQSSGLEWVEDCWNPTTHGIPTDGRPRTTGNCGQHVVRGSKDDQASTLRSAYRSSAEANAKGIGFRVVESLLDR
jgi:formylglycine-generating enzyme required for sulfatase activity